MSAFPPPNIYFNGIIYDSDYFTQSSSGSGLTKAQANALYLRKTISDTATAEETFNAVANALVAAIPHRNIIEMILEKSKDTKMNELVRSKLTKTKTNNPIDDELEFKAEPPAPKSNKASAPVKETKSESPVFAEDKDDDEFDDLFKDL
jgi:hypothetical protein